jgi:hypothetical protein
VKTTQKQFEQFQKAFMRYATILGLQNWDIVFFMSASKKNDAHILVNEQAHQVSVYLASDVSRPSADGIDHLARHEAIELLLGPSRVRALDRFTTKESVDEAFHGVVQAMMRFLR